VHLGKEEDAILGVLFLPLATQMVERAFVLQSPFGILPRSIFLLMTLSWSYTTVLFFLEARPFPLCFPPGFSL